MIRYDEILSVAERPHLALSIRGRALQILEMQILICQDFREVHWLTTPLRHCQ